MIKNKRILGIIPARGGSKGIPGKNTKLLGNKPLISWTIEEALKSDYLDNLIVSTDSHEIADIAIKYGTEVPFLRPKEYAQDDSTGVDVILHALSWLEKNAQPYHYFIYLQPTSPFRKVCHIEEAMEVFAVDSTTASVVSVCKPKYHPSWMKTIDDNGFMRDFCKPIELYPNRQSLPNVYVPNGAIYASRWDVFLNDGSFYKGNCRPYIMDEQDSLDLDTENDWQYAEFLIKGNNA